MKRVSCIEGIRGIASIMVMLSHFFVMFYPAFYWGGERTHCNNVDYYIGQTPFSFLLNGNSGVIFFLTVTGFGSYMVYKKGIGKVREYIVLRYLKLLIIAILSSLIVWILAKTNLIFARNIVEELKTPWFEGFDPLLHPYGALLLKDPLSSLSLYNSVLWTMKYFFVGSLISILFSMALEKKQKRFILFLLCVVILINLQKLYYIACIAGVFLADCYIHEDKKCTVLKGTMLILIGIYFCAYPSGIEPTLVCYKYLPFEYCTYYHLIGVGCIIYAILFCEKISNILNKRVFQMLGKYSFAVYIVHYGVLISFSAYLFMRLQSFFGYNINCMITGLCTIIIIAVFSYGIEKIVNILYKMLAYGYDKFIQ